MQTRLRGCLLTVTSLALLSPGQAQEKQPSFSLTISAPQTVKAGAAVPLGITAKNLSSTPIRFAIDISNNLAFDFLFSVKDSEGEDALETPYFQAVEGKDPHTTYHSRMHKDPSLSPGETLKLNMDLTQLFDFKPGKYTIQLSRPQSHLPTPMEPTLYGPFVTSNIVSLTVTP
ncbi:MAG: hypothetical protein WBV55_23750 [Candidatus Sulfotelmatobacter sp.]